MAACITLLQAMASCIVRNPMTDPRINLKNPVIAGVLAFLIPGAGHLYQGRKFKALVYFVCILGLFYSGMAMADWKAVQPPPKPRPSKIAVLKYAAQLAVGLPSMYGIVQRERYYSKSNQEPDYSNETITAPFVGDLELRADTPVFEEISGTIHLEPVTGSFGDVSLTGRLETTINGESRELLLGRNTRLGWPIKASEYRDVEAIVIRSADAPYDDVGAIRGVIPRSFWNWYQVPMDEVEMQDLHAQLGKYHELAMVFTWVAGLLNILAIWDAVEGPAYGYTEEHVDAGGDSESPATEQA